MSLPLYPLSGPLGLSPHQNTYSSQVGPALVLCSHAFPTFRFSLVVQPLSSRAKSSDASSRKPSLTLFS